MYVPLKTLDAHSLVDAWLDLARDPWTAVSLASIGVGIGAIARLLFEDAANSGTKNLVRRRVRPAPASSSSKKKAGRLPAASGDKTLVGVNWRTGSPAFITDSALNNHVLTIGTTGSGKTVTTLNLIESHIDRGLPVLILDGKGDVKTGRQIVAHARQMGRRAYLFTKRKTSWAAGARIIHSRRRIFRRSLTWWSPCTNGPCLTTKCWRKGTCRPFSKLRWRSENLLTC
ncbi:helicase HerA-like domain-containing protein [Devosia sp.]|uniref:helicase HerA-like domain-containing protein n=1 Tax=Devosia sp. TaxID=1871048 RepID=UPI00344F4F78